MIGSTWVIAKNTFREAIRDRILYGIFAFALIYILSTLFLWNIALGDELVVKSFGLAGIYVFGSIVMIFLGASSVHKEIERKTLYFVLSKPVSRGSVILGKFFGLYLAVAVTVVLMVLVYGAVLLYAGIGIDLRGLLAVGFQLVEAGLFVALLIFFSTIASPLPTMLASSVLLVSGHLLDSVLKNAREGGEVAYRIVEAMYYLLPNLEKFNLRNAAVHNVSISSGSLLFALLYGALYGGVLLYFAHAVFKRKEL